MICGSTKLSFYVESYFVRKFLCGDELGTEGEKVSLCGGEGISEVSDEGLVGCLGLTPMCYLCDCWDVVARILVVAM